MANVLDIRRRIRSVKNTQQITRAMKFVAAAKLRKAQERMFAARPYARRMLAVLNSLATRVTQESHPLLARREELRVEIIVITGDKGLCGAFNANIIKASTQFLKQLAEESKELQLALIGRKGRDFYARRHYRVRSEVINVMGDITYSRASDIAREVIHGFIDKEVDAVYLVYNEFKSVLRQHIVIEPLLPITRLEVASSERGLDYIYEQQPATLFDDLLPRHVITQLFHAMLESAAAEQAARMTAMDAATNNAGEMLDELTLKMNRIRQASITKEIIEIVSGAAALS